MKVTNYKKIDKIEFLYPELMAKDADAKLRKLFEQMQLTKDLIFEASMAADELRDRLEELEAEWNTAMNFANVTYVTEEKPEVRGEIHLGFNFGTDINKNIH